MYTNRNLIFSSPLTIVFLHLWVSPCGPSYPGSQSPEPFLTSFTGQTTRGHPPQSWWRFWHWGPVTTSESNPLPPAATFIYYKEQSQVQTFTVSHKICSSWSLHISINNKTNLSTYTACSRTLATGGRCRHAPPQPPGLTASTSTSLQNIKKIF